MALFEVRYTAKAREDLLRLFDFLLAHAMTAEDFERAQETLNTIESEIGTRLGRSPFIYRKAADDPFLRELLIADRASGYVALYEIEANSVINILAIRHQREDDYH